jgi:uncharacterized protein
MPDFRALAPHLEPHWRESVETRGIEMLESASYPPNAPITTRTDWRDEGGGRAGATLAQLRTHVLDRFGADIAILNCLFPVQLPFSEDMSAAFARGLNEWIAREWLDRDPRLHASIVLPMHSVEHSLAEIERHAGDRRFVQAMILAMGETPPGRRNSWPIYEALCRHDLPLAIHTGSSYRHPVTSVGWPSWYLEDYTAQQQGFQSALASLVTEGVFTKFPTLKVVLLESGVSWLPAFLWRLTKSWKGVRFEIPWVDRTPAEIVRDHVRLTVQPLDAPDDADTVRRLLDHLRSDELLLWASDWPHWQFDGDAVAPPGLPAELLPKIMVDNPLATYSRLREEGGTA